MTKENSRMRWVLLAVFLAACSTTKRNPEACLNDHCPDSELPFCDVDGSISGEPNTCIAVDCTPNEFEACRGDRALVCNSLGDNYDLVECEFGCSEGGCKTCDTPECEKRIIPKYLPTVCDVLAPRPELVIESTTIDTATDLECSTIVPQATGPEICVIRAGTISIPQNQTVTFTGARAVALVADRQLLVDGILDVSASSFTNGPGGGTIESGMTSSNTGGGGAGHKTDGGSGGSITTDGGAVNGGAARPHPGIVTELFGGPRPIPAGTRTGGGGGGALTLISCRGIVAISGLVDAGGGGGRAGRLTADQSVPPEFFPVHATGGGAGGTVVVQGMAISITGQIFANGGGGGGAHGTDNTGQPGDPTNGSDGLRSTMAAPGGLAVFGGGNGGTGGTSPPGGGVKSDSAPGAGGGSAGFILTYTPEFVFPTLAPVAVSPDIEPAEHVPTN